jgi:rare lipoprotein A
MPVKKVVALFLTVLVGVSFCAAEKKIQAGEATYNPDEPNLRAAHADLEPGTRVRVTNQKNNKAVIVTITGRIPSDLERILHLGKAGADNIEIAQVGTTPVLVEVLGGRRRSFQPAASPDAKLDATMAK